MLLHAHEARLVMLLRRCYRSPRSLSARRGERLYSTMWVLGTSAPRPRAGQSSCKTGNSARSLTSTTGGAPEHVAVLGGGITGLVAAATAAQLNPDTRVTVYESSDRLGGYVQSEVVQSSDGPVVFELGPRSLRPATARGYYALSMAQNLGLEDNMVFTSKDSPAGSNRFIYYPDKLVRVPSPNDGRLQVLYKLLTEPLFEGVAGALCAESQVPRRPDNLVDESIGGFLKRRSGGNKNLVDNIVSAVVHGIFAGDVNQLSVRSLMPRLWEAEGRFGSLSMGMVRNKPEGYGPNGISDLHESGEQILGQGLGEKARQASIYTFMNGMQTLPDALRRLIKGSRNANIRVGTSISGISNSPDGKTIRIKTFNNQPAQPYSHVISTLPSHNLSHLVNIPALSLIPYTTVMVVNLYYTNPHLVPRPGFGYLIPQSVPFKQNPEFALGVVFDSHATPYIDGAPGTKLTVMLGGHYWDGWSADELPTPEEGQRMAELVLARHLKITDKPDRVLATLHKNCIPQYTVGHKERLQSVDAGIRRLFGNKLSVGGAWVDGVGVNDCILSGAFQGLSIRKGYTGLELALESREKLRTMVPSGLMM
ncbi:oxygen-dependent protoporphyrinogen oxidase [Pseudogymnoascus destructans]|uniref:Protoporphyrinogen oxidase n=2 Tax=Pseudogymnoascus destructans TaxID=655981 RepID=L8FWY4_PSED2|nr:oxygen-dependent protoporphyrinogen oxidase [Pseudogymnoascus destructans]ELR04221.1 protoporphyrinogen oxidase [Pseudogymnoascus destructans 20631-21]OAF56023.2 oxygen-dependent protoporphyrinogen oxidase [Pseudogymnoascus destructans]